MSDIVVRVVDHEEMFNKLADRFIRIGWHIPHKNLAKNQNELSHIPKVECLDSTLPIINANI